MGPSFFVTKLQSLLKKNLGFCQATHPLEPPPELAGQQNRTEHL